MDTPLWQVEEPILKRNIAAMAEAAKRAGVKLRPHFKAHKCLPIARLQMAHGAVGMTVAKLGEAEVLMDGGITDILMAFPLWGDEKWRRYAALARRGRVAVTVDSIEHVEWLARKAAEEKVRIPVFVEIDSGLKRCGVQPEEAEELIRRIGREEQLAFEGILTHAGHVYGASGPDEAAKIGWDEGRMMAGLAESLREKGITVPDVSTGSTPTASYNLQVPGITEIRPGNYVFHDRTQVSLGVCRWENCALRVKTRVVGHPAKNRWILDGGSKTFALDRGAHGKENMAGFGHVVEYPHLVLGRLSEEHGIMEGDGAGPRIGDVVTVIPNHACTCINLAGDVQVVRDGQVVDHWAVDARGLVR